MEPRAPNSAASKWLPAIAVMASAAMETLDTSVVNVSLRHIAGSMSATVDEATWVLTSYIVANAIILPMSGWLASYFPAGAAAPPQAQAAGGAAAAAEVEVAGVPR